MMTPKKPRSKVTPLRTAQQLRVDNQTLTEQLLDARQKLEASTIEKTRMRMTTASLMASMRDVVLHSTEKIHLTLWQRLYAHLFPQGFAISVSYVTRSMIWRDMIAVMHDHTVEVKPVISRPIVTNLIKPTKES